MNTALKTMAAFYFWEWNYTNRNIAFIELCSNARSIISKEYSTENIMHYNQLLWDEYCCLYKDISDIVLYFPLVHGLSIPPHCYQSSRSVDSYVRSVSTGSFISKKKRLLISGLDISDLNQKADTIGRLRKIADILERFETVEEVEAAILQDGLKVRLKIDRIGSRIAGLWLSDRVAELMNKRGAVRQAIRELTIRDDFVNLGLENAEDADLRFYLRRTQECISCHKVLPFTKRGTDN